VRRFSMFFCPFCGGAFKTLRGLKKHVHAKHYHNNQCPICGKRYSKPCSLGLHLRNNADDPRHLVLLYLFRGRRSYRFKGKEKAIELLKSGLRL